MAKIDAKNEFAVCGIVKKEKEIHPSFAVTSKVVEVEPQCDKCLIKMEKTLNFIVGMLCIGKT